MCAYRWTPLKQLIRIGIKLYVNGELQEMNGSNQPTQNTTFGLMGTGYIHTIGSYTNTSEYIGGYLSDIYFVDGTQVTPVGNFIEKDSTSGVYKPKVYDLSSDGSNSFRIDAQAGHDAELLVTSDHADGSTLFADSSGSGHGITANGDPNHQDTVGNPFDASGSAIHFDGTGDSLTTAAHANLAIASGDSFTAECWVYFTSTGGSYQAIISGYISTGWVIELAAGYWGVYDSSGDRQTSSTAATTGTWHHVALVKTDNSTDGARLYLNGNKIDDVTVSSSLTGSRSITLGDFYAAGTTYEFAGYMYDARFTKGVEKYTGSTYTVPTEPFESTYIAIGADSSGNKNHFTPTNLNNARCCARYFYE